MADTHRHDPQTQADEGRYDRRRRCERWFIRRGVPHAIAGYSATSDVWTRSVPFLVVVFFSEVVLGFGERFTGWAQAGVIVAGLAILLSVAVTVNRLRGRRPFELPDDVGWLELSAFVLIPPLLPLLFGVERGWPIVGLIALNVVILLVTYVVTSYGMVPMFRWGAAHMAGQLFALARLMARTLPLLLLFATFIFLNAEMWQVASDFTPLYYAITIGALVIVAIMFLALRVPREIEEVERFESWDDVCVAAQATDAPIGEVDPSDPPDGIPPLDRNLRFNIGLLLVMAQFVQTLLVATIIGAVYVGFGLLAVRESTLLQWTTETDVEPLARIGSGDSAMVLTWEHLAVAGFIAAFSTLQFAVSLTTDRVYREEFFHDLGSEICEVLAVRAVYLHALVR